MIYHTITTIMSDNRPRTVTDLGHALRARGIEAAPDEIMAELRSMVRTGVLRYCSENKTGDVPAIYERKK